jgi:hypothetical protein
MKPMLIAPGSEHLRLKCDILLSTSAFTFNLRRYIMDEFREAAARCDLVRRCRLNR